MCEKYKLGRLLRYRVPPEVPGISVAERLRRCICVGVLRFTHGKDFHERCGAASTLDLCVLCREACALGFRVWVRFS